MKLSITLILFTLISFSFKAQVVYTNPNPDIDLNYFESQTIYPLSSDISSVSFYLRIHPLPDSEQNGSDSIQFNLGMNNCYFLKSLNGEYPDTINWGNPINANSPWQWTSEWPSSHVIISTTQGSETDGIWADVDSKFLGFRCFYEGDTIYGWMRISIDNDVPSIRLHDYAINSTPNQGLVAGEGLEFCAINLSLNDVSDFGDERDLFLRYNIPAIEDSIDIYKIFIVPSNIADNFGLEEAENTLPENYIQITPSGQNYSDTIPTGTLDVEGNQILEQIPYKIYVMSSYHFGSNIGNALSEPSNEIILSSNLKYTNLEPDLIAYGSTEGPMQQILDFNNDGITDLIFSFSSENYFDGEYSQILEIWSGTCWRFTTVNYGTVLDNTLYYHWGNQTVCYLEAHWETDGENGSHLVWDCGIDLVDKFVGFKLMTDIDTTFGWVRISTDCSQQKLIIKDYAYMQGGQINVGQGLPVYPENISVTDNSNNHNSSDIFLSYHNSFLESSVAENRVIVVPSENLDTFTLEMAESLSPEKYFSIIPNGNNFAGSLPADLLDVNGDEIIEARSYKVLILAIAESSSSIENILSIPSDEIILHTLTGHISDLTVSHTYEGGNDNTINIDFYTPSDESGILEYRTYIIPENEAEIFDTTNAASIIEGNYFVYETGTTSHHISSSVNASDVTDIHGSILNKNDTYKIAVMSVTNWNVTTCNNIVISTNSINFSILCETVPSVYLKDLANASNSSDIELSFVAVEDESQISMYRIFIQKESDGEVLTTEDANLINEENYYETPLSEAPGETVSITLPSNLTQIDGSEVIEDEAYLFYIMAVANNTTTNTNSLSSPSPRFILGSPGYFFTYQKSGQEILYNNTPVIEISAHREQLQYNMDINMDGVDDIMFDVIQNGSPMYEIGEVSLTTLNSTKTIGQSSFSTALPEYYYLDENAPWIEGELKLAESGFGPGNPSSIISGNWLNIGSAYMAVRILTDTDTDTIYAWVRLKVEINYSTKLFIYDNALFGKNLNIEDNNISSTSIYPNPNSGAFIIETKEINKPIDYEIFDISGRLIKSLTVHSKYTSVNLENNESGMYFIRLKNDAGSAKKIIIE